MPIWSQQLGALPSAQMQAGDYNSAYATLRAYLIPNSNADRSTAEFLVLVLMLYWQSGHTVETNQQKQLAAAV